MFALPRPQKTDAQAGNCGLVLLNQPLVQPPSKAASRYFKTNLNKPSIRLKYNSPIFYGVFFGSIGEKKISEKELIQNSK